MVALVRVGPNPNYKLPAKKDRATPEEAAAWAEISKVWDSIKGEQPKMLPHVCAIENTKNSGGMYAILTESEAPAATAILMPEQMTADQLKLTALQLGVDLSKPMKKADLIKAVRKAMDAVQVSDDDADEDDAA
jgi:hypothetical protein